MLLYRKTVLEFQYRNGVVTKTKGNYVDLSKWYVVEKTILFTCFIFTDWEGNTDYTHEVGYEKDFSGHTDYSQDGWVKFIESAIKCVQYDHDEKIDLNIYVYAYYRINPIAYIKYPIKMKWANIKDWYVLQFPYYREEIIGTFRYYVERIKSIFRKF